MKPEDLNILVIGDIMLDEYIIGTVDRISPEAPVPIVLENDRKYCLGGCGNVANNLNNLKVNTTCLSVIGFDESGNTINNLLREKNIKNIGIYSTTPTTTKTRIVTDNNIQLLRVDKEVIEYPEYKKYEIKNQIKSILTDNLYDIIIISDYNKGIIFEDAISIISFYKKTAIIIADIKPNNIKYLKEDIYLLKPNEKEYNKIKEMCIHSTYTLKTLGKNGMVLLDGLDIVQTVKSIPVEVYNVSGAGDTVMAVLATCIGLNKDIHTSVFIANECGRYVVQFPDTTPIDYNFFLNLLYSDLTEKVNATLSKICNTIPSNPKCS